MMRKIFFVLFVIFTSPLIYSQTKPLIETFLPGASITQIAGENGDLWIATDGKGIFHYSAKENNWVNYSTVLGNIQHDFFFCIAVSKDYVWAGSADGLFTLERKRNIWTKRKFAKGGEMGNWVRSVAYDKYLNAVWIGRFANLTKLEVAKQKFTDYDLTVNGDTKTNNIKMIKLDGDSVIWFGTEVGLHKYNKKYELEENRSHQFISNRDNFFNGEGDAASVADMLFEGENIWFGLDEFITLQKPKFNIGGVYYFDRKIIWERFDKQEGLPANGVFCLARTGNFIWASVYEFNKKNKNQVGQGITLINRVTHKVINISKDDLNLRSDKILSLYFDGTNMWIGTEAGLLKLNISNPMATIISSAN